MTILETKDLEKKFGELTAFSGININLKKGEVFGLLGPNGAGKTTLIRSLLGLVKPTSGSVKIFGMQPKRNFRNTAFFGNPIRFGISQPYQTQRKNNRTPNQIGSKMIASGKFMSNPIKNGENHCSLKHYLKFCNGVKSFGKGSPCGVLLFLCYKLL